MRGNNLYLVLHTYDGRPDLRFVGLDTPVRRATLLATGQELPFTQHGDELTVHGLPPLPPTPLFPVIRLECAGKPEGGAWAKKRIWGEATDEFIKWASKRGTSVWTDGKER